LLYILPRNQRPIPIKEAASFDGLFFLRALYERCRLLALSGQSSRSRVCPLLETKADKGGFWQALARLLMTQLRHWLCTAAMFLMPVSAPIKVLV
jgi:hypothetical protein